MSDETKRYLSKYSKQERILNWLSYFKWWILLFLVILIAAIRLIWQVVHQLQPDYQIAYVGVGPLPDDTVHALESALAELATDQNGDGRVVIQVNQYPTIAKDADPDEALNQSAWETRLMADLVNGDSSFFLLSDPDAFQSSYHILAKADGTIPSDSDHAGLDKVFCWADCPVLASLDLGTYRETVAGQSVTGDNQSLLRDLYIGRRYFRNDTNLSPEGSHALWDTFTEGAVK